MECLQRMKDNNADFVRWYEIDAILYIVVSPSYTDKEIVHAKALFVEADYFAQYNAIAIDLNKQPGTSHITEETVKKYRDRRSNNPINFEL